MKIINKTKSTVLSEKAYKAESLPEKSIGLLDPNKPRSLILSTHFGIHTFGMQETIDILILDDKEMVVRTKKNLKPQSIFLWNPRYSRVIELPGGTINNTQTSIGDLIGIKT